MDSTTVTLTEPLAPLTLDTVVSAVSCYGGSNGTATIIPTGGTTPYAYLWDHGEITNSVNGLDVGVYDVIVTDSTGCFTTQSFNMNDPYNISFLLVYIECRCHVVS